MFPVRLTVLAILCFLTLIVGPPRVAMGSPGDLAPDAKGWQCGHVSRWLTQATRGGGQRGPGDPQPETPDTDVLHTKIDIDVNSTAHTVFGTVTITAASRVNGLTQFVVYLDPNGGLMNVSRVSGNVTGSAGFTHVAEKVTVSLDATYNVGQQFTVSLQYGGTPNPSDGIYWGNHFNGSEFVDIVATLSEPFYARSWWVGKDVLDDKCTFDIWVTVPLSYTVVSNGILRGISPAGIGKHRYEWEEINPMIPYLASIAVADYELYERTYNHLGDTMPMTFYMLPESNTPSWRNICDTYVSMTEVFSTVFGQYPFVNEKGGMAHTPTLGPFMEHQTIPSMPTFQYLSINAHELAHQWWGDWTTCETWGDIWLNEGITSFSEAIWEEFKPGGSVAAYKARMAARHPSNTDSQVYVTNVNSTSGIFASTVYYKGAWVTHMLRHVLTDAVFFQALRDYSTAYAGDSATTAEFIASVSATAGYDLTFFTDQWVMNPGSPDYLYSWRHVQAGAQDFLLLQIEQTQPQRPPGYALMTMPIDIRVTTALGSTTHVVWCIDQVETFAIPVAAAPLQVQLDPDEWILTHSVTQTSPGAITANCQGDMNKDGRLDGTDIPSFLETLLQPATWPAAWRRSDMNFDGRADEADLPLFVTALLNGCNLP